MNASFIKRFIAYLIDFVFVMSIMMIINYFLIKIDNTFIMNNINDITEKYLENRISFSKYFEQYSIYLNELDKRNIIFNLINFLLIFLYFVILPIVTNGKTLGKSILKIKIKRKDNKKLNIINTMIRSIITVGLLYMLVSFITLYLVDSKIYFLILIILGFIQILLVIISGFMILYRHDKRGLQDILSKSNVITTNEVK